ncbi:hypothetical protein M1116_01700 [Patescibacteria group bacterium]|nr:hypothetical protein [Patescibacteria group bacterium]
MLSLVKREDASEKILLVMTSALSSMLVTRMLLEITNDPQLGRGPWHLAHALWGGAAMFVGGLLPLLYHGEKVRRMGAIIFGLGTGLFIDEVGKFVTKDNNYFFQPAILIIYGFFIMLFLLYRYLEKVNPRDPKTLLYQTLSQLEDVAENDLELKEKEKLIKRLQIVSSRTSGEVKFFSDHLRKLITALPVQKEASHPSFLHYAYRKLRWFSYYKIFKQKVVLYLLFVLAAANILTNFTSTYQLLLWRHDGNSLATFFEEEVVFPRFDSYMVGGKMVVEGLASVLFLMGIFWVLNKKIKRGLLFFQSGLLVNIFLVALFNFYFQQFSAVVGLSINIAILLGITRLRRDFLV